MKRANGEGSIQRRKNGRWLGQITIGTNAEGKPVKRTVSGKTQQEVRDKLESLKRDRADGRLVVSDAAKMTVGDFLDKWLADVVKPNRADKTHTSYESICRLHIKPMIGHLKLTKLTPLHVQEMLAAQSRKGIGNRTHCDLYKVLHTALNQSVRWQLVRFNVCQSVEAPKRKQREMKSLTIEQVKQLQNHERKTNRNYKIKKLRLHNFFILALATGLRRGELIGLHWSDIHLVGAEPYLTVTRAATFDHGQRTIGDLKTKSSRRRVSLPPTAVVVLTDQRAQNLREGFAAGHIVFPNAKGGYLWECTIRRGWKKIKEDLGIEGIRFHDLRHSHASLLASLGEWVAPIFCTRGYESRGWVVVNAGLSRLCGGLSGGAAGARDAAQPAANWAGVW